MEQYAPARRAVSRATYRVPRSGRARWPSRSSKPVRRRNPAVGQFDSGAAPFSFPSPCKASAKPHPGGRMRAAAGDTRADMSRFVALTATFAAAALVGAASAAPPHRPRPQDRSPRRGDDGHRRRQRQPERHRDELVRRVRDEHELRLEDLAASAGSGTSSGPSPDVDRARSRDDSTTASSRRRPAARRMAPTASSSPRLRHRRRQAARAA